MRDDDDDEGIDPFGCLFGLFLLGMLALVIAKILFEFAKALFK
jgi:hypothetical protein